MTITFHQYDHTRKLYFVKWIENHWKKKYVIFRKKWKNQNWWKPCVSCRKVYHGLNDALDICVQEKHYQVLPTQVLPIRENLGLRTWTDMHGKAWWTRQREQTYMAGIRMGLLDLMGSWYLGITSQISKASLTSISGTWNYSLKTSSI